jgi:putative phosphoribosyl transferase
MNATSASRQEVIEREVQINTGRELLEGSLSLPKNPSGIALFAHGSGSSRHSPRNRFVAQVLQSEGIATLLFDLLTHEEDVADRRTAALRFDLKLLTKRLVGATHWVMGYPSTEALKVGYFGASTGAAAALAAAAQLRETVAAIVSRGGRPDLAGASLGLVRAPTLLIVGGDDELVAQLNREAMAKMVCAPKELVVIPGATHLFEEPGALEEVSRIAAQWFSEHFLGVITSDLRRRQRAAAGRSDAY